MINEVNFQKTGSIFPKFSKANSTLLRVAIRPVLAGQSRFLGLVPVFWPVNHYVPELTILSEDFF